METSCYQKIFQYLENQSYSGITDKNGKRCLRKLAKRYILIGGKLYLNVKEPKPLVLQITQLDNVLKEMHDDLGHQCANYTYYITKERYFWPKCLDTIRKYVNNCERCKLNSYSLKRPIEPLKPLPVIARPWYRVGMDLTGPLIISNGYQYILTMVDHFTKFVETRKLRNKETIEVARGVFSVYCSKGAPSQIITDNGREFTSKLMEELQNKFNCRLIFTTPYHPQTNGLTESYHKAIKSYLCKTLTEKKEQWSEHLDHITFSINIRPRLDSTGFSAFELMHGFRKARTLIAEENNVLNGDEFWGNSDLVLEYSKEIEHLGQNINEIVSKNLQSSKKRMKERYDKKINPKLKVKFKVGDKVFIPNRKRTKGKLEDHWLGPYPVKKINLETVIVDKGKLFQKIKCSQVKMSSQTEGQDGSGTNISVSKYNQLNLATNDLVSTESPILIREEVIQIPIFEEQIMDILNSMKPSIVSSIRSETFLSELHYELHKRLNQNPKDILEWRQEFFPDAHQLSCDSFDIIEKLMEWYKEAMNANVKSWLSTDEDRKNAFFWDKKAMDYVTKVIYPVLSDIIAPQLEIHSEIPVSNESFQQTKQSTGSSLSKMELLCANWGGCSKSIRFMNTCSIDNLLTLMSLNITTILQRISKNSIKLTDEGYELIRLINLRDFNSTKQWLAEKLKLTVQCNKTYDFFGSEGPFIQFVNQATGSDRYIVSYQCWKCFTLSERTLNLSSVYKFVESCQNSIDTQIARSTCLKCRDDTAVFENTACQFMDYPLLFIMEVSHLALDEVEGINRTISIIHKDIPIIFNLLGYTIHNSDHFCLRFTQNDAWFYYDGMTRPKVSEVDNSNLRGHEIISSIVYIISP